MTRCQSVRKTVTHFPTRGPMISSTAIFSPHSSDATRLEGERRHAQRRSAEAAGYALLPLLLLFSGCACHRYGTLVARRVEVPGAVVLDIHALGFWLRPAGHDAGLSAGYRRATYVIPHGDRAGVLSEGWSWFHVPAFAVVPLAMAQTSFGLEVQALAGWRRVSVGYLDQVITDGGPADDSREVRLHLDRRDLRRTTLDMNTHPKTP